MLSLTWAAGCHWKIRHFQRWCLLAERAETWFLVSKSLSSKPLPSSSHSSLCDSTQITQLQESLGNVVLILQSLQYMGRGWIQAFKLLGYTQQYFTLGFWSMYYTYILRYKRPCRDISLSTFVFCLSLHGCLCIHAHLPPPPPTHTEESAFDELSLLVFISYPR